MGWIQIEENFLNTWFSSGKSLSEDGAKKPFHTGTAFYTINPSVTGLDTLSPGKLGRAADFQHRAATWWEMSPNPRSLNPSLTTPVFTIRVPSKIRVVLAGEGRRAARQGRGGGRGTIAQHGAAEYRYRAQPGAKATQLFGHYSLTLLLCLNTDLLAFDYSGLAMPAYWQILLTNSENKFSPSTPSWMKHPDLHRKQE